MTQRVIRVVDDAQGYRGISVSWIIGIKTTGTFEGPTHKISFSQTVVSIWGNCRIRRQRPVQPQHLKKHLDRYMERKGIKVQMHKNAISVGGYHGQHGLVGPRGLFLSCITLSIFSKLTGFSAFK